MLSSRAQETEQIARVDNPAEIVRLREGSPPEAAPSNYLTMKIVSLGFLTLGCVFPSHVPIASVCSEEYDVDRWKDLILAHS
jgi:hypothetical protein